jgi:putative transcriptional regulator
MATSLARLAWTLALLPALVPLALLRTPAQPTSSLAGQLLVASPSIGDPRFAGTVVMLARHDRNGAFGLIINRPLGERTLESLLAGRGGKDGNAAPAGSLRVFTGGPVQPALGFVLHSTDYRLPDTTDIDGRFAITGNWEILQAIATRSLAKEADGVPVAAPRHSLVTFGYAGWGAGQLERELSQRAWFIAPADARLVFEEERDKVWEIAMSRRTQDL